MCPLDVSFIKPGSLNIEGWNIETRVTTPAPTIHRMLERPGLLQSLQRGMQAAQRSGPAEWKQMPESRVAMDEG